MEALCFGEVLKFSDIFNFGFALVRGSDVDRDRDT
jgi:hypothetical protein